MGAFRNLETKLTAWLASRSIAKVGKREWFSALMGMGNPGGFSGAQVGRLTASMPKSSMSVNADLDGQLEILRARARGLTANNEFARRFLSLCAANIVGATGPTLQVRALLARADPKSPVRLDKDANDAIEIHWKRWHRVADITGRSTLPHLLRMLVKSVARDGESLIRIVRNRQLPYGIAIQLLEADRLDITINQVFPGGGVVRQGVEIDSMGRPVAYYLRSAHPGDRLNPQGKVERVPASEIYHVFLPERAEQVRGYTWFHAVLMRASQLQGFEESAVIAARIGASKVAALIPGEESAGNAGEQLGDAKDSSGNFQINVEPGDLFEAPAGYSLESWDPQYPHENFESFVNQCVRALAAGLDVAAHNLSGNMRDVNYSSARIAELAERDAWTILQGWLIDTVLIPLYREWLASALLLNQVTFDVSGKALPVDKYAKFADASAFRGRRWSWVDPEKEANAAKTLISLCLASRTGIAASQGLEFEDIADELKQEREILEAAGLPAVVQDASSQPPTPDPAAAVAATGKALAAALEKMPAPQVKAEVTVEASKAPEVHVAPPAVNVTSEITVPERQVTLEARIEAPAVSVAAPVVNVKAFPERTIETIERDDKGEIARIRREAAD